MVLRSISGFGDYEFAKKMSGGGPVFVLKNSLTCPVSAKALSQVEEFAKNNVDIPCFVVNVQDSRSVCDRIAQDTGVNHESPQIFLFKGGISVWNESHFHVTKVNMNKALKL